MKSIPVPHILYEDSDILVCEKPSGIATQSRKASVPDLERTLLNYLAGKDKGHRHPPYLGVIHRLDQPVSGILVFAKNPESCRQLNRQMTGRTFEKRYLALVDGIPPAADGILTDYLVKESSSNTSRVCRQNTPGAKAARLHYKLIETIPPSDGNGERSLLEITLDTGRHHQIRVQLAHIGCPIVGDTKYHPHPGHPASQQDIYLCAYRLSFPHPRTGHRMDFQLSEPLWK